MTKYSSNLRLQTDMDFSNTDNDENHRLLEEIMNSNNNNNNNDNNDNNNNNNTHNSTNNNDKFNNLTSFLTDPSFLSISSYPQLNSENGISNHGHTNDKPINRDADNDTPISINMQDAHEFLKFDINTLNNTLSNEDKFNSTSDLMRANIYPNTPAEQHEKISYKRHMTNQAQSFSNTPQVSMNTNEHGVYGENEPVASFLDDMFSTTHHVGSQSSDIHSVPFHNNSHQQSHHGSVSNIDNPILHESSSGHHIYKSAFSTSITKDPIGNNIQSSSFSEPINPDFLFNNLNNGGVDESLMDYTDDFSSSLGSSITSDIMTPSSFSLNPQQLDTFARSDSNSNSLSSSIRSPSATSTSLRNVNYLSQSLRQPNIMGTTPKSRHASLATNLNSVDSLSMSVPKSLSHLSTEEKLRRKRDFHNAVERRRRDLIKQKIKELGNLVPPSLLCFDSTGKQVKPNKGIILNKTVDYITFLMRVLEAQDAKKEHLISKINELEAQFGNININDSRGPQFNRSDATLVNHNTGNFNSFGLNLENVTVAKTDINNLGTADTAIKVEAQTHVSDDLKQFLSGDIVEAEDNAKLRFNNNENKNPAEYLLEFDP
ncbi:retrograde regulation protein 3 [Monosporozyma servazzii]